MMFVTKRYHLSELERLKSELSYLNLSRTDERRLYNARILDLQNQIQDLRQLVFPPQSTREISKEAREADAIIGVSEKHPQMSEEELTRILEGSREADLLISGNYDSDLLN